MDSEIQEIKAMMQEHIAIAKDTNAKVRSLHNASRRAVFFRLAYWAVIIGVAIWSFQYIQPYLGMFTKLYSQLGQLPSFFPH